MFNTDINMASESQILKGTYLNGLHPEHDAHEGVD
jgi:hypothetical protein